MTPYTPATEEVCPKRIWVLTVLTEDEDAIGELPRGLAFHLARCSSCRAVADRLRRTNSALAALGAVEAPPLFERAQQQALQALRNGAALTGRVSLDDDCDEDPVRIRSGIGYARLATAASVAILIVAGGLWSLRTPRQEPGAANPPMAARPSANPFGPTDEKHRTAFAVDNHALTGQSRPDERHSAADQPFAEQSPLLECESANWPDQIMSGQNACIPRRPWLRLPFRSRTAAELHRIDSPPSAVLSNPPSERR